MTSKMRRSLFPLVGKSRYNHVHVHGHGRLVAQWVDDQARLRRKDHPVGILDTRRRLALARTRALPARRRRTASLVESSTLEINW